MTDSCDKMEEQTEIIITSETEGKRLDAVLAEKTDGLSRSFLQKLFEEGKVFRNGKLCSKKEKGVEGDCILVRIPAPEKLDQRLPTQPDFLCYQKKLYAGREYGDHDGMQSIPDATAFAIPG